MVQAIVRSELVYYKSKFSMLCIVDRVLYHDEIFVLCNLDYGGGCAGYLQEIASKFFTMFQNDHSPPRRSDRK